MIVVAIDPGNVTGWARFHDERLIDCQKLSPERVVFARAQADVVIIEWPQIYRARKSKGNPNDLIDLAVLVGRYVERALSAGALVMTLTPHEWKGSVPKAVHNRRVLAALTEAERALVPSDHNAIDATGLGLWWLKKEGLRT